jgi:class 3 adenylate cyclase
MVDRGDHRIGDVERQQAIDLLRSQIGAGRLTLDEFSDLAGQVYAAQTYRELEDVARNLPAGLVPESRPPAPPTTSFPATGADGSGADARVGQPRRTGPARRRFVAVMSGATARGRWRAAPEITAFAFWGGVTIDLREAEIEGPVVDITAWAVMGGVTITVPEGIRAELDGMVLMGGSSDLTRATEPLPGSPLVRVHARGLWGGVTVWSKKARTPRADEPARDVAGADPPSSIGHVGPAHPLGPAQRILDDVAASLPRVEFPAGVPSKTGGSPAPPVPPRSPRGSRQHTPRDGHAAGQASARPPSGTLTMMVTDIADSTRVAERLGDRGWVAVLGAHNALVREQVGRHGGTEIKAQGDGFLVVFSSARRAILAAVGVQRALARYRDDHPDPPVAVRIGLHTGEIVDVDGDVFGQNVVVAARIADQAAPSEIVVSALTRDLTVSGGDLSFGPADEVELKGLSQPWRVHRVTWSREPA